MNFLFVFYRFLNKTFLTNHASEKEVQIKIEELSYYLDIRTIYLRKVLVYETKSWSILSKTLHTNMRIFSSFPSEVKSLFETAI
jgi:hypothetical protein